MRSTLQTRSSLISLATLLFALGAPVIGCAEALTLGSPKHQAAQIIWSFDHQGEARFCYDRDPEFVFFKYDQPSQTTSIQSMSIDGQERTIGMFPGPPDERSLSCSDDGSIIAALDAEQTGLYIIHAGQLSTYAFDHSLVYSVAGPLISSNGKIVSVPGVPTHRAGPDIIKQLDLYTSERAENTFIINGTVYVTRENSI